MDHDTRQVAAAEEAAEPPADDPVTPLAAQGALRRLAARLARTPPRRVALLVAALIAVWLLSMALKLNITPRRQALKAVPDTLRALAATVVLFGVGGFGLVRLLLPEGLRRHELLWILPTGGCAVGLLMTLLGNLHIPYAANLALTLTAAIVLAVVAVRREGWPARPSVELAWPGFLALVVVAVAVIPMVFELHYASVTGSGSDAHMAAGSANFLKHAAPSGIDISQPIDRMPILWQSKPPIYYAFAGVSTLAGLDTWQVLTPLEGALLALAALGLYLVAREMLGAGTLVGAAAMGLAGLDRMALHTGLNPYFNQTWGYVAMPFTLVLAWYVVQPRAGPARRRGALALLVLFGLVLIDAYPLAAPIPLIPIAIFLFVERRRRIAAGEPLLRLRSLVRGRRSLLWMVPLVAALGAGGYGIYNKSAGALKVLAPGGSLIQWGGDLRAFIPNNFFFSLPDTHLGSLFYLALLVLVWLGLRRQPRGLAWGLGALFAIGLLMAAYFHGRKYGYYFHFKILAFVAPLLLVCAVVGAARVRRWGPAFLVLFAFVAAGSVQDELTHTGLQLGRPTIELSSWARSLPAHASVRLDMGGGQQLWAAYFLASRPLCSQQPLLDTDYPHVPTSRKADYIVATHDGGRPRDAIGPALRDNEGYDLYRENPAVPGVAHCSQRMESRLLPGQAH